jgi:3',5'-cyclic-AMP phosphodiesterase
MAQPISRLSADRYEARGEAVLIAQLTDLHVTTPDARSLGGADSVARAQAAARWLKGLDTPPDLVLFTGDNVQRGEPAEYAAFMAVFADLPFPARILPGNHDDRAALRAAAPPGWVPADGEFLHQAFEADGLGFILLDSLNPGTVGGVLCDARLDWLAARLAERRGAPTLIALHHPPFDSGITGLDDHDLKGRDRLAEIVAAHSGVVGVICGHLHRTVTRAWAGTMALAAPSAGRQFALSLVPGAPAAWSDDPPAAALHRRQPGESLTAHIVNIPQS